MTVSETYYKFLLNNNYKEIFGLPGSYIMPLWQQFGKEIKIVLSRHESGAVFMADGWSRNNNKPGIVLTTIGPGLTNAITGIACAYQDSIPLIVISGYVNTNMNHRGAFQNSDEKDRGFSPTELLKPITKATFIPQTATEAVEALEKAFEISMTGRKGPTHISLPFDIQNAEVNINPTPNIRPLKNESNWINQFIDIYNSSKKPLIICGNGCYLAEATDDMNKLSNKLNIPVISTIKGLSACDIANKLYWGVTGTIAKKSLINRLNEYNSDLIISLGSSLSLNSFSGFDTLFQDVKIVRVDIDEKQFNNYRQATLNIKSGIKNFLSVLQNLNLEPKSNNTEYDWTNEEPLPEDNMFSKISFYLNKKMTSKSLIIPDAGNHWLDILYWCKPRGRLTIFTNAGLASMGHAIGAAIGFKMANKDKKVVCITGDGSFLMSGMEIAEAVNQHLDIIFIVCNNSSLGRARVYQEMNNDRIVSTKYENTVNIKQISEGLKATATTTVDNYEDFKNTYDDYSKKKGVKIIEVIVEKKDKPKILR